MKYNTVKLGEYLYIKGRIGWKGLKKSEYLEHSEYRIINGEALTEDGINWDKAGFITKERYDESPEIMLKEEDILISKDGTIGKIGFINKLEQPTTVASGIFVIRNLKPEIINTRFIYNFLCSHYFKAFITMRTEGSVIPHLYQKDFVDLDFPLPQKETQEKIVSILDGISAQIDINKKINEKLEEQAKAIFKSWFIDFELFNKTKPSDWNYGTIQDLASEIVCGKTPSTKKKEYYGEDIPFITIPDMHNSVYTVKTERSLSLLGADSQPTKTLPKNSICVSCIGTAGLVTLVSTPSQTNQQINSIIPKENISPYFVYLLMKTKSDEINKYGQSGSTIVNLNKTQFAKLECIIPSTESLIEFNDLLEPLFNKILVNMHENIVLTNLRDTLLPKLMSGEIDVSEVEV
ncbi:restriction endonuclease subunit S [Anaerofustis sp. NSJ-163]|uniref:restriction endonuclease subunit S n=1 Tax=Anaerofustis sp. NSJ-163 TaxID=2944391 RepID=UPI00209C293C|nr:restriction endonuclease subunit S [Anaerofustis sp. NSJ-163]MCO8192944.1 restriction endonuclease subunit S [Anaerofustis sp. NSJ-163]